MQIHYTGRNITVTPALKSFTEEKLSRLAHVGHISNLNVTFHVENVTHTAEATAQLNGTEVHASAKADDMYTAVDMLLDKLSGQIRKHKEKLTNHRD